MERRLAAILTADLAGYSRLVAEGRRLAFPIGISLGDVVVDGDDIYGGSPRPPHRNRALAESGCSLARSAGSRAGLDGRPTTGPGWCASPAGGGTRR